MVVVAGRARSRGLSGPAGTGASTSTSSTRPASTWPAVFFGKGLSDGIQGPFPTFNAYLRVRGDKELLFVRGPHSEVAFGPGNVALVQDRMTQFAVRAVLGQRTNQPTYSTLKEAVAASPQIWEPSTQPTFESKP